MYPITPIMGAPRLTAQRALKRGRAHTPLNGRKV